MGRLRLKLPTLRRPKLRMPKVSRLLRIRIGTWTGGGLVSAGVGMRWGLPLAFIVAGALLAAYCLLVADIAEPTEGNGRPQTW